MSTVLAYTSPALGHLFPMVPLLLELRARGHRVHVRTLADQVEHLESLGLEASAQDSRVADVAHADWEARNPKESLAMAVRTFAERARIDGPDFQDALDAVQPDVCVVDINAWGALVAAESSGVPWVTFSPFTPPLRSRSAPPFGPGLAPMSGPLGRLRDGIARPLVMGVAERLFGPAIGELRTSAGLPPVRNADAFFRRAPLMMITTAEPFEYPRPDWGDDIRMIGACAWEPPTATPPWLADVDAPVVLVTTSSEYQDDGVLVRTALEALADEPVHVVATMPAGLADDLPVPANASVQAFVPHGPVLDRAVVAVTHGGMGATQKALARGVPVCVVPFGRDQLEVARRVEVSGAGVRLPAKRLEPERLRAAVHTAITRADGARRVAQGYAATGGPAAGAAEMERRFGLTSTSPHDPARP